MTPDTHTLVEQTLLAAYGPLQYYAGWLLKPQAISIPFFIAACFGIAIGLKTGEIFLSTTLGFAFGIFIIIISALFTNPIPNKTIDTLTDAISIIQTCPDASLTFTDNTVTIFTRNTNAPGTSFFESKHRKKNETYILGKALPTTEKYSVVVGKQVEIEAKLLFAIPDRDIQNKITIAKPSASQLH